MKIFKYELPVGDYCYLNLPRGAQVLHVNAQGEHLFLWALVDPEVLVDPEGTERRKFQVAATGFSDIIKDPSYIGTALMNNGAMVWHVFEHKET